MTSTGLGRHNSKPILDWDEVEMEGESTQASALLPEQAPEARPDKGAAAEQREKSTSPWTAMRKIFKR